MSRIFRPFKIIQRLSAAYHEIKKKKFDILISKSMIEQKKFQTFTNHESDTMIAFFHLIKKLFPFFKKGFLFHFCDFF